ncbi:MAG TPA: hypothetical protein VG076_10675 [Acidimicrobiales bacterium]|jgi:uncharacterized protein (DUF305 family)|nr:hypothetical protein [Acidimicrobiales bacterium]
MNTRSAPLATAIVVVALTAGACGGGGHGTGVASLANSHTTTTVKKSKEAAKQEMQDAALAFAHCMRDHGVDMPDPTFSDNGNGNAGFAIRQAGPGSGSGARPADAALQAAQTACQPIMDKAQQDMPQPSPQEQAKMRDQALKFAKCMRAHGIDMPDPTFDVNGGAKIQMHADAPANNSSGPVTNGNGAAPPPPGDNAKMDAATKACGGPGGGGEFSTGSASK